MKYLIAFLLIFLLGLVGVNSCEETPKAEFIKSQHPKRQNTPFSAAVRSGNLLFLSGQIGRNHDTGILPEGIAAQTRQAIQNIEAVLKHNNSSLDKVIKCTVILSDINDFEAFNAEYVKYFPNKPARTTFAASGLAGQALIEIDVIAEP
ncbi:MAG: RidA family protein [Flavobacteriaceae bacterium]|nr:RidA family protein [Flavobacteriaceae bacterium]